MQKIKKDIFISCRYDGSGNQIANRLSQNLEAMGYSVYYDANESYAHSFPEHIREAVISCKDFILILSVGCLERLIRNDLYTSMETLIPEAAYQLGLLYRDGVLHDPPKPDYIYAAHYFRDAADKGHIQAAHEFALLCFRPSGKYRKDLQNAHRYFTMAADGGHITSQYVLGYMYRHGLVKKDLRMAIKYLEKAKAQGHAFSSAELAFIYQQPECQNYQRAFECAKFAASQGAPEGELIYGNLLFFGRGCEPDMNKAYEKYTRAYQHGIYFASVMRKKIDHIRDAGNNA